jgi:hypothetical protein
MELLSLESKRTLRIEGYPRRASGVDADVSTASAAIR